MKKTILTCIIVLILALNFSCALAFEKEDVNISTSLNKIDVSVTSDKDLGRMTLQVLDQNGTKMLYIGQENSYTSKAENSNGKTEYKYVFDSFNFPSDAVTGNYNFKLRGSDGAIVVKPYSFVNIYDSYYFLNGLDAATDVYQFLFDNQAKSLVDLTGYFALPATTGGERELMNTLLVGLDLSVEADFSNLAAKETLFKEQFTSGMLAAEILAADTAEKWVSAVENAATPFGLETAETAYYSKLSDKKAAYSYFTKVASLEKTAVARQFDKAVMLCAVNDFDFGSTGAILNHYENKSVITLNRSIYNTLSETKKLTVCQRLKDKVKDKTVDTAEKLETEFYNISETVSKEPENGGGSSGGGGSSSSGKQEISVEVDTTGNNDTSSSENTAPNKTFKDIDEVPWAKGYILSLESKGILSGKGDGKFYPSANMLREEFVKVISVACKLDTSSSNVNFTDTTVGAWYLPYINASVNANIINGIGDGKFGVGKSITREDAAVIIARALEYAGVERNGEAEDFVDSLEVSPYAQDAVKKLRELGIINGDDKGCFLPKATISRAEISKMICGMLDVMGG